MSARHTPGPWRDMGHHMIGTGSGFETTIVCECHGAGSADELEANKALIIAASTMLAALEKIALSKQTNPEAHWIARAALASAAHPISDHPLETTLGVPA